MCTSYVYQWQEKLIAKQVFVDFLVGYLKDGGGGGIIPTLILAIVSTLTKEGGTEWLRRSYSACVFLVRAGSRMVKTVPSVSSVCMVMSPPNNRAIKRAE
ncbi:MAG: hypothetical protein HW380_1643 [Magnetococcales bacterium]|nr:hypothetical protein [Magnetococcales bacterium]